VLFSVLCFVARLDAADATVIIPGGNGTFTTNIVFNTTELGAHKTLSVAPATGYHFKAVPTVNFDSSIIMVQQTSYTECGAMYEMWLVGNHREGTAQISGTITPGSCNGGGGNGGHGGGGGTSPPPTDRGFEINVLQRQTVIYFTDPANGTNLTICAGRTTNIAVKVVLGDATVPASGTVTFSAPSNLGTISPGSVALDGGGAASATFNASTNGGVGTITASTTDLRDAFGNTLPNISTNLTVNGLKVDLNIDGVAETNEETVGKFMWWNADDENSNGTPDKDEEPAGGIANENDLVKLTLSFIPTNVPGTVRLTISQGADKIKIWQEQSKQNKLTPSGTPPSLTWSPAAMPTNLFLEGVAGSTNIRDVVIQLAYEPSSTSALCSDTVKATVVPLIIIGHASANLYGIAWRPSGDYALVVGSGGTVATYSYPALSNLSSGASERLDAVAWNPGGTLAVLAGGTWPSCPDGHVGVVLSYNGSTFVDITPTNVPGYNPGSILSRHYVKFWDADWKPGASYCLLAAENQGTAYKCDGTNVVFLGGPGGADTSVVAWKPDSSYAVFCGDAGANHKWTEAGGFTNLFPALPSTGLLEFDWRPDGAEALIGGTAGRVWKYTQAAGPTLLRDGPGDWMTGIVWEPNGRYAIVCGHDGLVLVYDPTDSSLHDVNCDTSKHLEKGAWKPNGNYATVVRHN
jgi:WD40 repeat protein